MSVADSETRFAPERSGARSGTPAFGPRGLVDPYTSATTAIPHTDHGGPTKRGRRSVVKPEVVPPDINLYLGPRPALTYEQREEIARLYDDGHDAFSLADRFNVSPRTIYRYANRPTDPLRSAIEARLASLLEPWPEVAGSRYGREPAIPYMARELAAAIRRYGGQS